MTIALSLCFYLFGSVGVQLTPTSGTARAAELQSLTEAQITILTDGRQEQLPTEQLRRVSFHDNEAANDDPIRMILADGSTFAISHFSQTGVELQLKSRSLPTVATLPKQAVKSILAQPTLTDAQMAQWRAWEATPATADMLVLQRKDKQLQAIEGAIASIDDANVNFVFDGDTIEVKRSRVIGILFFSGPALRLPSARAQLVTTDGAQLQVASLTTRDNQLQLKTLSGVDLAIPFDRIRYVDFAAVSTAYLSDLKPERDSQTPYLEIPFLAELETQWFETQRDRQISRAALELPTAQGIPQSYAKGLSLHSRTERVYRLAGEYRRFVALSGMSESLGVGAVELIILLDGKESSRIPMTASSGNVPLDIDVTGVNRLTIQVDYGEGTDFGDYVSLCDARLVK